MSKLNEIKNLNDSGFFDWNTLTLDQMVDFLRKKYRIDNSGTAKCIFSLIEFYEKNKK